MRSLNLMLLPVSQCETPWSLHRNRSPQRDKQRKLKRSSNFLLGSHYKIQGTNFLISASDSSANTMDKTDLFKWDDNLNRAAVAMPGIWDIHFRRIRTLFTLVGCIFQIQLNIVFRRPWPPFTIMPTSEILKALYGEPYKWKGFNVSIEGYSFRWTKQKKN